MKYLCLTVLLILYPWSSVAAKHYLGALLAQEQTTGAAAVIGALAGLVTALTGLVAGVVVLIRMARELRKRDDFTDRRVDATDRKVETTDARVDLLWEFLNRRGVAESVSKLKEPKEGGMVVTGHSPTVELILRRSVREKYQERIADLRRILGAATSAGDARPVRVRFSEMLEREMGEWMIRQICIPHEVSNGACHDAAWEVANGDFTRNAGSIPV